LSSYQFIESAAHRPVDDLIGSGILSALLAKLPVALSAQLVYFGLHPTKQLLRRLGWNPCPLKVPGFSSLRQDLAAHVFDFIPNSVQFHCQPQSYRRLSVH
jgi:hypothetical protein